MAIVKIEWNKGGHVKIESSVIQMSALADRSQKLEQEQVSSLAVTNSAPAIAGSSVVLEHEAEYQYQSKDHLYLYSNNKVSSQGEVAEEAVNSKLLTEMVEISLSGKEAVSALELKNGQAIGVPIPGFTGSAEISFSQYQFISESQNLTFSSNGSIKTEDGREVDFSLYLELKHEASYETTESFVLEVQRMKDPLVINFGTESVSLTDQYFEFDLEGDGDTETIASLASGSGYLVLDRNGNGLVDDGSELFGTQTGQGFAELAEFDNDGNLWIDENDAVFSELSLWVRDENGNDQLRSLKDIGVGAIYLGSAEGSFNLHSSTGNVLGEVKSSGVVLMEDGEVRTIQEIDMADFSVPSEISLGDEFQFANQPATQASTQELSETETREDFWVIAISNALEKLNEIREQQKAYNESLKVGNEQAISPVEQILQKMEEIRLEMLERKRRSADHMYRKFN